MNKRQRKKREKKIMNEKLIECGKTWATRTGEINSLTQGWDESPNLNMSEVRVAQTK